MIRLRSRYAIDKENPLHELERHLIRLSSQGLLRSSMIHFGVTTDPFLPFEGKFDASMRFLELFKKYTPGFLSIQTRSPLVVIAMPVLRKLGAHVSVTLGIETHKDEAVERYTPGLPRVKERLKTAAALKQFGIEVALQVSPVLPYGDWKSDAKEFAQILCENGDLVYVRSITDGSDKAERKIRTTTLAKKLVQDMKYHWLRPDTANPLIGAIEKIAPEKLRVPERKGLKEKQMKMFAA